MADSSQAGGPEGYGTKSLLFATITCHLLRLPPELRSMIYCPLITSGNIEFLRASKALNEEAMECLYSHGILRIPPIIDSHVERRIASAMGKKIQDMRIDLILGFANSILPTTGLGMLQTLIRSRRMVRKSCFITIYHHSLRHQSERTILKLKPIVKFTKFLKRFQKVTLTLHNISSYHPQDRRNIIHLQSHHLELLQGLENTISPILGPAFRPSNARPDARYLDPAYSVWDKSTKLYPSAQYLEFHPLKK